MLGMLIGGLLGGTLCDKFGRKNTIRVATLLIIPTTMFGGFSPNYTCYAFLRQVTISFWKILDKILKNQHFRALTCIAMPCVWAGTYPMIMEAFGKSHRKTVMLVKDFAWPTCQMILICVVYFIRQWTNLHLCIGTICLFSLPFFLVLPDSVRWLATNNQNSKVGSVS